MKDSKQVEKKGNSAGAGIVGAVVGASVAVVATKVLGNKKTRDKMIRAMSDAKEKVMDTIQDVEEKAMDAKKKMDKHKTYK